MKLQNVIKLIGEIRDYFMPANTTAKPDTAVLASLDEKAKRRYEALRRWRNELARSRSVAPFIIFSNRTLMEIAAQQPLSPELLLEVHGVGPKKLTEYGVAVLQVMERGAIGEENPALPPQDRDGGTSSPQLGH